MKKMETDGKLYRIYKQPGSHISTKKDEKGRVSALQFRDSDNKLNGPLVMEEAGTDEPNRLNEQHPILDWALNEIVKPTVEYFLMVGTDRLMDWMRDEGISKIKNSSGKIIADAKLYADAFRDALSGKELKAVRLTREASKISTAIQTDLIVDETFKCSPDQIEQVIQTMRKSAVTMAACIQILANTIVESKGLESNELEEAKKQLEQLSTQEIMNSITLMLDEKNSGLLDAKSYEILSAFQQGDLLIEGRREPIVKYLEL